MIGFIEGRALNTGDGVITICTDGSRIGYEVHVSNPCEDKEPCMYWIHEHAPQDAPHELYGFREREQRDLFRRLLNIKGVGPKVAMRIVASNELLTTAEGHLVFDSFNAIERLKKLRGVGATLAQRIVEEIR